MKYLGVACKCFQGWHAGALKMSRQYFKSHSNARVGWTWHLHSCKSHRSRM